MDPLEELRKTRLKKLETIKKFGVLPYPSKSKRTHKISDCLKSFNNLAQLKKEVVLTGRIMALRRHGGSAFLDLEDSSGKIQALFRRDRLGAKQYQFFSDNFDIGDFIETRGILFKTKKGEKTIEVADFKILAKSLRPLPAKWYGLKDVEERFRKRYLDLIFNPEAKRNFILRSSVIKELRAFLEREGFLEVETPILQPVYGGASARPFKTHLNALDIDLYLRIAPELYLKRLLVGGFEKVYEIGRVFRNEGMDRFHNPDFTSLEFYWAYADYKDMMKITEKMFSHLLKNIFKSLKIKYQQKTIDFTSPWQRVEFSQILKKETKIDLDEIHPLALKKKAKELGIEVEEEEKAVIGDKIYKKFCLPKIWQPTFIVHHPVAKTALAKTIENNPKKLASFQLVAGGWELAWGYSELNNPLEQKERFSRQEKLLKTGFKEAHPMDKDYIEALEYGMPPAAGFGMGIDRLVALLTNSYSIREVILFPLMRSN